ncbi:MAG TPA: hypothetical protein PK017_09805, partial [Acidobacteriota bacterium]|nr:hypothetical protein [Acidobacteriota bacterium]HPB28524.1 hypothetical protein [Acidobacteriota bacterium]
MKYTKFTPFRLTCTECAVIMQIANHFFRSGLRAGLFFFMGHLTGDPVKNPGEMLAAQIPESHWTRGMQSTWASASVVEVQLRAPPEAPAVVRVDHFVGIEAV